MSKTGLKVLEFFVCLYGVTTLTAQAGMSIGYWLLVGATLFIAVRAWKSGSLRQGDPALAGDALGGVTRDWLALYLRVTIALTLTIGLGAGLQLLWQVRVFDRAAEYSNIQSLFKLSYLFLPVWLFWIIEQLAAGENRRLSQSEWQRVSVRAHLAWFATFAVMVVIGFQQYWTGWPREQPIPGNPGHFHSSLFMGHHLSVASTLIFPFFMFLDLRGHRPSWLEKSGNRLTNERPEIGFRAVWAIVVALGALTLFFTFSRMLWVALPVGLAVYAYFLLPRRSWLIGCGGLLGAGLIASQLPMVQSRLQDQLGVGDRTWLWKANWALFKESPLFGVGLRKNSELAGYWLQKQLNQSHVFSGHAHNLYLDLLSGTGIFGLMAWLTWALVVTLLFVRVARKRGKPGFLAAWIVFLLNGMTQVNFWEGKVLHQLVWVIMLAYLTWKSEEPSVLTQSRERSVAETELLRGGSLSV